MIIGLPFIFGISRVASRRSGRLRVRDLPRHSVTVVGRSGRKNPEESPNFKGGIRILVPLGLQKTPAVSAD